MQAEIDYKTARIFALEELSLCTPKDFIDWGYQALEGGSENVTVAILAGLSPDTSYFEARECFFQALGEMDLVPTRGQQAIDDYLEKAAHAIIDGHSDYKEILKISHEITIKPSAQSSRFNISVLSSLYWAIQDLELGEPSWSYYYENLNLDSPAKSVRHECQIMLGLLPPDPIPKFVSALAEEKRPTWMSKLRKLLGL